MDWGQLRTIVWLRGRLVRNQWSRGGRFNAVLTIIVVWIGFIVGAAGGLGGILAGTFALAKAEPPVMLLGPMVGASPSAEATSASAPTSIPTSELGVTGRWRISSRVRKRATLRRSSCR